MLDKVQPNIQKQTNKQTAMFGLETKHDLTYQPAIICKVFKVVLPLSLIANSALIIQI